MMLDDAMHIATARKREALWQAVMSAKLTDEIAVVAVGESKSFSVPLPDGNNVTLRAERQADYSFDWYIE